MNEFQEIVLKGLAYGLAIGIGIIAFGFVIVVWSKFLKWWNSTSED